MTQAKSSTREALRGLMIRDLHSLDSEVAAYPDDESLWKTAPGISNPGGTLALHLAGNLRHFIGAQLGGSGYVRNRDAEFGTKGLSRDEVRANVKAAIEELESAFERIDDSALEEVYPLPIAERQVQTGAFLIHLAVHCTYHLGQVDYHRRLLTKDPVPVENVATKKIPVAG